MRFNRLIVLICGAILFGLAVEIFADEPMITAGSADTKLENMGSAAQQALKPVLVGKSEEEGDKILGQFRLFEAAGFSPDQAVVAAMIALAEAQAEREAAEMDAAEKKFLGIDWGMGIYAAFDLDGESRVESASVVDGIVRVEKESGVSLGIALDAHYFFNAKKDAGGNTTIGWGPYLAIQTSGENLIDSWALGCMVGFRRDPKKSTSFNLGVGLRVEPGVKTLGDGIEENQPLPGDETEVRFKEEDRMGVIVMFSASF